MTAKNILFVGVDLKTYTGVRQILAEHGLSVDIALFEHAYYDAAKAYQAHLVILDLDKPGRQFGDMYKQLRSLSAAPIIVLSSSSAPVDKITVLDGGASDYVAKPFSEGELVARVRAVLRQRAVTARPAVRRAASRLRVDIGRREASVDGRLIKLTNREVRVLAVLAADPGRILKHGDIIAQAWGRIDAVNVDYLRVCIMSLRSKLGEGAGLIVTHSGIGYSIAE